MEEEKFTRVAITVTGTQTGGRTVISGISHFIVRGPFRPESHVNPFKSPILLI